MSRKLRRGDIAHLFSIVAVACLPGIALVSGGCVEIAFLLRGGSGVGADGGGFSDSIGDDSSGGGNVGDPPTVRLTASNTSPTAQEEVFLNCSLTSGDATGLSFAFAPNDGRLVVDPQQGTASFIVSQTDVNQAFTFTCTVTTETGTGASSNPVVVIPTG